MYLDVAELSECGRARDEVAKLALHLAGGCWPNGKNNCCYIGGPAHAARAAECAARGIVDVRETRTAKSRQTAESRARGPWSSECRALIERHSPAAGRQCH